MASYPNSLGSPATVTSTSVPTAKQSSISVAVRVRPFTEAESNRLVKIDNDDVFLGDGCLTSDNNNNNNNSNSNGNGNGNGSSAANSSGASTSRRAIFNTLGGLRKIINVVDDRMLIIASKRFVFDRLFDEDCTQDQVYRNTTQPLLDSVLDGYNATVFAYGATGCGKTHTISGTPEDPGVIFLTMKELYNRIEELKDTKIIDISLSYLEIYNETIRDLLNPMTQCKNLVIREDANNKISVSNLSRHRPNSVEEVMQLILEGNKNRTCSPTEANATSSRSHAVLQINVIQKDRTGDITEEHTFATLSIIDLAGSERAAATKNRGARLNEGANINKSLLALGNCINALCDPRRRNHVPYRDSKLTRLLKFSLGGNCKTVMIVCVSPSSQHYDETLNTLKYADRAKEIKTKLIRNLEHHHHHH
uniref:Kinesin-like protein,Kinesin-1 heavy chain n=1 Tax=Candida albicans TaxID=5476 RepID=UPI0020B637BB|nr:Chain K, Kinesin-like protein,Kinesin-1 heavy chain [synthetic construct]7TR2_K Chain K, Kinesin-like protein,Kinesin-1 heavy chain [synthetic construct]